MSGKIKTILVVNSGSSSLKFMVFDMDGEKMLAKGLVERIGNPGSRLVYNRAGEEKTARAVKAPTHAEALKAVCAILADPECGCLKSLKEVDAIGHRVLHGGESFSAPVLVDAVTLKKLHKLIPLGPLHMPPNISGIEACRKAFKGVPNVAVFDTAFHQTMPPAAYRYAIPAKYYKKYALRKYGFHGTSHNYIVEAAAKFLKKPVSKVNLVTCHLGNGSSIAAVKNGKVLDTSMGLTPLAGLVMGTRSGDIDPAVAFFIGKTENLSCEQLDNLFNKQSGLQGMTGVAGGDMRDICAKAKAGDEDCKTALEVFGHRAAFYVGGYNTLVGGADAIIFTGGIGENSDEGRRQIISRLGALGIKLDVKANAACRGVQGVVSTKDSKIPCVVIPTNEELMIARQTFREVSAAK